MLFKAAAAAAAVVIACGTAPVWAFNDNDGQWAGTAQTVAPSAAPTVGPSPAVAAPAGCRVRPHLTPEQRAQRKAMRAERAQRLAARGVAPTAVRSRPRLPRC